MSAVHLDAEVVELLRDSPDLLAVADAVAATQAVERGRSRRRLVRWAGFLAAAVAAGVTALVAPWPGGGSGFVAKALAALGDGQVIRVVSTSPVTGSALVDIRSGASRPVEVRTEILFDRTRKLERIVSSSGGVTISDVLETPQGSWSATGRIYTCAWIAAHPVQATRARVSCSLNGFNGTTPRKLPEPVPTLDPALAGFVSDYRTALEKGQAERDGRGVVDGREVEWLRFTFVDHGPPGTPATRRVERVALDTQTLKPVRVETRLQGHTQTARIAAIETAPLLTGQFARPRLIPARERPVTSNVRSQKPATLRSATAALNGRLLWTGRTLDGLDLTETRVQAIVTGYGAFSGLRPTHSVGAELVYGGPVSFNAATRYVRLRQAIRPEMLYGFYPGHAPKEGTMRVTAIAVGLGTGGQLVQTGTIWQGVLETHERFIEIEATSRQLLIDAARHLETRT